MVKMKKSYKIFIIVLLILVLLCTILPLIYVFTSSLRSNMEIAEYSKDLSLYTFIPKEITFSNYIEIFTIYGMGRPLFNAFITIMLTFIFGTIVNSLAAYAFVMFDFKYKKIFFGIVLLAMMIPFEAISFPLFQIVNNMGMSDTYMGLIIPGVADGFIIFLYIQFMKDIPKSVYESARIDGASSFKIYYRITMPLTMSVMIMSGMIVFINTWNSYLWPLLVARDESVRLPQIALSDFFGQYSTQWSHFYAASVVLIIIPLVVFYPLQKYFIEGVTSGSNK